MSLDLVVAMTDPGLSNAELLRRVHAALSTCDSVRGLSRVDRLAEQPGRVAETIMAASEDEGIGDSDLAKRQSEIDACPFGLEARWQATRYFREPGRGTCVDSYGLSLTIFSAERRQRRYRGMNGACEWSGGNQRFFGTNGKQARDRDCGLRNVELLVKELSAVVERLEVRLVGVPVGEYDPDGENPLAAAWLYFDGQAYDQQREDVYLDLAATACGPLYYSKRGLKGDLRSLQLEGEI